MTGNDRIAVDPDVLVGKPVIKGTRITVELVIDLMAQGWTTEQILDEYDHLTAEDIRACLTYAGELLKAERVYPTLSPDAAGGATCMKQVIAFSRSRRYGR